MALATQCPHCYTSFRVANDQLKLHAGLVRCGSCKQTFNGIEHLLAPGEAPRQAPITKVPEEQQIIETIGEAGHPPSIDSDLRSPDLSIISTATAAALAPEPSDTPPTQELPNTLQETLVVVNEEQDALLESEQNPLTTNTDLTSETTIEFLPEDDSETTTPAQTTSSDFDFVEQFDPDESDSDNEAMQKDAMLQQVSTHLETIEPTLGLEQATKTNAETRLSSKIEFELTQEERDLVEQADQLHQLEIENRLAILDEDSKEWSKDEPGFDQEFILESPKPSEEFNATETVQLTKKPTVSRHKELLESTTDNKVELEEDPEVATPGFVLLAEKKRRYGKWQTLGYSVGCVLLIIGALAQSTFFFRSAIAAQFPGVKPYLVQACQRLSCQIKLPAERRMLEITGSELLVLHDELKINTLSFQIQNKSTTSQEWPVAELVLKDARGKIVLHKFIPPIEYLNNSAEVVKGIPARSESDHKLHFELNTIKASNYSVGIFYP
jgi:predicted Zn finger-like uncharacterized protein